MKVCMLTSFHEADDNRIFYKEGKSLSKAHEVTVIAPGKDNSRASKDGIDVITFRRATAKPMHWKNLMNLYRTAKEEMFDVYHAHEPGSLFVGALLKGRRGGKLVYDSHEHYPAIISENTSIPGPMKGLAFYVSYALENILISKADRVITVSPILGRRFKGTGKRPVYIYNAPRLENFTSNSEKDIDAIYIGNVGRKRGLTQFLRVAAAVSANRPDARFVVLGKIYDTDGYKARVRRFISQHGLENNVQFIDWMPPDDVPKFISRARMGVILFKGDSMNNAVGVPNKLFEYMAAGIPVIASDLPGLRSIVDRENCGILIEPGDWAGIRDAVHSILSNPGTAGAMGRNGMDAAVGRYNWAAMEGRLLAMYRELE